MSRETTTPGQGIEAAAEFLGPGFRREVHKEGQDISGPIKAEGPVPKVKFCWLNPGVVCRDGKCTVRCNRHPWHIEWRRGCIHDEKGFYRTTPPIKPGPPK